MNRGKNQTHNQTTTDNPDENGPWDSFFNSTDLVTDDFGLSDEEQSWLNQEPVGRESFD
ncbi:hypothetical protein KXJ70_11740 [Zhongshania sp. CAU 1632]|jgi:hypothetical protein|uniref:Uncharacterized protein n=1 Tax=Zhongshania aquimaris TaxID=2857107 RepID=A0ABS6VT01_9GAMM|nr:hypothetical protein [Zhongshania aquimaris]|tara:strand:+ start:4720 stop:4896 length:177 start_codon:yes stop_codon:yes gene_type:complete